MSKEQGGPRGFRMQDTEPAAGAQDPPLPEMTFTALVLSLSAGAMVHLGEVPEGAGQAPEPNLALARQTIDILELLERKTQGNLDPDEARLLGSLLHDLRMKYVTRSRA
jgi:hypothetical protein